VSQNGADVIFLHVEEDNSERESCNHDKIKENPALDTAYLYEAEQKAFHFVTTVNVSFKVKINQLRLTNRQVTYIKCLYLH